MIEVIWTSGSIDKLEIHRRLKVGKFLDRRSATEAMRDFRDALRAGR
ncbi:MAG TPA: hypothetical protein VH165_20190 [Kofleriaceae bacterium]|nr:hypothetical protein [Kofleriaceae bacterium]